MVQFCCVVGCGNRSNREYRRFYRLPSVPKPLDKSSAKAELIRKRRRQWLTNIARVDLKDGDSSYSSGYIRVCSDHFFSGKPTELTNVDNIDWAPTLKMGKSRIRVKGNNVKKEMFGFSASERRRHLKVTKWTENNSMIQTIVQTTAKTDVSEIEERRTLALETEYVDKRKYYKPKKNPWGNKRRDIDQKKNPLEEKSYFQKKIHLRVKFRQQKRKQQRADTLSFLKRKTEMRVKMSQLKMMQDQSKEAAFRRKRPMIAIGCLEDDHCYKSSQFIKLYDPTVVPLSSTPSTSPLLFTPSTCTPLIHKITIETNALDKDAQSSNKELPFFEIQSPANWDKSLYKNIKSECDVYSANVCQTVSDVPLEECGVHENEYGVQCDEECGIQFEDEMDFQFQGACDVQFENECGTQFEDECNFKTEDECGTEFKGECDFLSEDECDDVSSQVWQCIAPSADENERILEIMNEQFPKVKEEIKEEPL